MTATKRSTADQLTELRVNLRAAGYSPIPAKGKSTNVAGWQKKTAASPDVIARWTNRYADHINTGLLAIHTLGLDVDIKNEAAAKAVEALVRERYGQRGKVLLRVGQAPKRLIPFQASATFKKITASVIAPDGDTRQKIEFLSDGQMFVGFGTHPDTCAPYQWHGGEPGSVKRDELPEITEAEARQFVDDVVQLLCDKFGYKQKRPSTNVKPETDGEDWSKLLANIHAGVELHDSTLVLAAKLVCSGMSGGAAVNVLRALMEASEAPHDKRWRERYDDIPRSVSSAEKEFKQDAANELTVKPHVFPDEASIERWDFLHDKHLLRKTVSGTAAMGAAGKSSLAVVEALAMASGKELLGLKVPGQLRVLLINLEDNRNAMDKRIAAAMKHHRLTVEDIGGRLFTKAKGEIVFKIAEQSGAGSIERNDAFIDKLLGIVKSNNIDVISIDPFVSTHAVNENDNSAIRDVIECYDYIAEQGNCAIHLWHHTRKGNGLGASVDSARGASSFVDACRSVRILETMTTDEGKKQKIANHRRYFRAFSGKLNFAPPSENSEWYHVKSVPILNGDCDSCYVQADGGNGGDDVGVVERWSLPEAAELTPENIDAIKKAVIDGNWRENIRADMWVGKAVGPILGLDPELNRRDITQIIRKLIFEKVLKTIPRKTKDRKDCLFVVPGDWSAPVAELRPAPVPPTGAE